MNVALVVFGGMAVAAGGWLCLTAFGTTTPPLARTVAHLHRPPLRRPAKSDRWTAFGASTLGLLGAVSYTHLTLPTSDLV